MAVSRFEKFISCITEIDLYWHRVATAVMKPLGLKGNYAVYFTCLYKHPEGATAAQLGVECDKDKADVSRDMAALEKLGLVQRVLSSGSIYRAKLILTENGRKTAQKVMDMAEKAVNMVGGELSDEERASFYHGLDIITDNLRKLSETGLSEEA